MKRVWRASLTVRVGVAAVLVLHAIAHAPGVLGAWKLAEFEDASFRPHVLLTDAGDTLVAVLGGFWLLAALLFVVAAVGLVRHAPWGTFVTFLAAIVSLALTILWLEDAVVGLAINIAIVTVLFLFNVWTLWRDFDSGRAQPGTPSRS